MRIVRRGLLGLVGLVLLAGLLGGGALWWSLPGGDIEEEVAGLSAAVHVGFDADGVPRIEAATALDGAAALGFVHARDRMFQMELMRRAASGTLSEMVGGSTLRLDRVMRVLGLRRRAEADLAGLDAETRGMLEAYSRGVNAWIGRRGRFAAPELVVLGRPEAWTPVDSLLWGKTMALYLAGNWRGELLRAALMQRLPPERVRALWPRQAPFADARTGAAAERLAALVPGFPEPLTWPDSASNEWAVDGAHSASGAPLLAGDPHLGYGFPSIWYLARIQTPAGVLAGATAPGVPFLVIGHNGRIAWTFTTAGADTQDVFIETPAGEGSYLTPSGPLPYSTREERIRVRFGADEVLQVRETRHGPVLSDLDAPGDAPGGPVFAVAMASLQPGDAAPGLLALNRAGSVAEAGRAAARIVAPVQNLLVADRDGIGQFTTGRVPVRAGGDGTVPSDGADGRHDWTGFAEGEALPHVVNPAAGRIVNANERVAGPDFPVFMGQDWFGDWRARRIRAMLDARTLHGLPSFAQMQVDSVDGFAQAVLPRLLQVRGEDEAARAALATLQRWDGWWMRMDRAQPVLFSAWMRAFYGALLARDGVPAGVAGAPSDVIADALGAGEQGWCGGGCDSLLSRSLSEAARDFDGDAHWGDLHQAEFAHPLLGRLPLIGTWFSPHVGQPGDATTVFAGGMFAPEWAAVHGPSFRGVYDLADLDRSLFSLAPGQSGHLARRQARSLMRRWVYGSTVPLGPLVRGAREVETIELRP